MTEQETEDAGLSSTEYVKCVTAFMDDVSRWCGDCGLAVERNLVTLWEEHMDKYDAPGLHISKDGASLGRVVPTGSRIIGADGRVDLNGRITRHSLLFYRGRSPSPPARPIVGRRAAAASSIRTRPGVDEDGWYWIEASVRRSMRVDESLFLDLLTDVSDYEF
ncbi:hypothetical protein Bsp3421_005558 [Burkholderia sp. FERM BP-3421]|uniref:hypothetical protein n=1 Tax=Burkholderia sp. FERM BP-3421 TaxID=1494466 RepID=UPI0023608DF9|nr:hypothetical protein [Burkholderia sp. FERM BP-3421]WDD95386.1 hypothetical protein Bsp3421_005558 [Burkholderia sp. FERM BP-3421]